MSGGAACVGASHLFFAPVGETSSQRVEREAVCRKVCARCPLIDPCREAARSGREWGFWGGEGEAERAAAGYPPESSGGRYSAGRLAVNRDLARVSEQ